MKIIRFILLFLILVGALQAQQAFHCKYLAGWGEKGSSPLQFREPGGISVDPRGFLYLADTGNQRIQKLDSRGGFISEIGGFGWNAEQFDHPVALWAGNGLDVLVADYNNNRIQRFDKDLHSLSSYRSSEDDPEQLQFGLPLDLDLSPQGELFCLDGFNRRILKFDAQGKPQRSFGDFDSGQGRLHSPRRMMIYSAGLIMVSDLNPPRIVVFDVHGNFLRIFGESILKKPEDMCVFKNESVMVADAGLQDVLWFNAETGVIEARLSEIQTGLARLREPVSLSIYKNRLFILDRKSSLIHIFEINSVSESVH